MIQGHGDDSYHYEDIRMNFSSNIYAHADLSALKAFLSSRLDVVAAYPEPDAHSLASLIAGRLHVPEDCVIVTNGATEAIYLTAQVLRANGIRHYLVTHPTFSEYEDACRMFGMEEGRGGVRWICTPNNPDGKVVRLKGDTPITVLDQSYEDLTTALLMPPEEAVQSAGIIQIHSLTKTYAVPGLRIGYIVTTPRLAALLRRFQRPWSVNGLAVEAGKWLLMNEAKAVPCLTDYLAEARRLNMMLNQLPHVSAMPTDTNCMLATIDYHTSAELKDYLARHHHMLIRDASNFPGLDAHYFRVSAQTPEEDDALVAAIREFVL